ncbi:MAG TPA: hypothetical protein VGM44_07120, partial [Polyangiaceae bacterium]
MASPAPESPIDQALTFAERGEHEIALRYAASLLEGDAKSALRVLVTAWMLGSLGDADNAKLGLEVAVELAVDSGSLPLSVAAACKLREFGGDHEASLSLIARAFSKGSARLLDKRGAPPNLPGISPNFTPFHESLEGEELLKKAAEILAQAIQAFKDDRAANPAPKVSPQTLFSALDEQGLLAMIE